MQESIYIHRYRLHSRTGLNSRSDLTEHEGILVRIEENGVSGYGCLHPWEELGDSSLPELLDELKEGRISRQVRSMMDCVEVDRAARAKGVSLFKGLSIPDSHATIVGGVERVHQAIEEGFSTVKIKAGREVEKELALVKEMHAAYPELRWRFDFNGVLGAGQFENFVHELGDSVREQVDFLEDPVRLGDPSWETVRDRYAIKTAVDRGIGHATGEFDISIIKPAINDMDKICDAAQHYGRNVVVTSYMDHPIGQCYAAYCAGILNQKYLGLIDPVCGLMTHELYEPTTFSERLGTKSPKWHFAPSTNQGTGLGFDDLLENLDWERL